MPGHGLPVSSEPRGLRDDGDRRRDIRSVLLSVPPWKRQHRGTASLCLLSKASRGPWAPHCPIPLHGIPSPASGTSISSWFLEAVQFCGHQGPGCWPRALGDSFPKEPPGRVEALTPLTSWVVARGEGCREGLEGTDLHNLHCVSAEGAGGL